MAQVIDIPGVGEVEFPDGMSDADIVAAAKRLSAGPKTIPSHVPGAGGPVSPAATKVDSGVRGAFQGLSAGWGDEAAAGLAAVAPFLDREAAKGDTIGERYQNARDFYRGLNSRAEAANPSTYLAGYVGGSVAPILTGAGAASQGAKAVTGGRALLTASGQGALSGAGLSDASSPVGVASDTALGAGVGLAGYGTGKVLGKGLAWAADKGRRLVRTGTARASQEAADAATAEVRSLEAAARERAANAYRQMERVNAALADKTLPAEERAALEAFKQSPEYADLLAANAKGALAAAPEAAAEREAARAVASEARAALPVEIERQTAARLVPQPKADAKSFLKMYAEPVAWAYGANKLAEEMGADPETRTGAAVVAGLIGGRTRAGKALWTRLSRPAHQVAIGNTLQRVGESEALARAMASRLIPATAIPMMVSHGDN